MRMHLYGTKKLSVIAIAAGLLLGLAVAAEAKECYSPDVRSKERAFSRAVITEGGKPAARIQDNDAVIFFNYRADRARQMTHALTDPTLTQLPRAKVILPISSLKVPADVFGDSEKHIEIAPGEAQTEYLFEPASGDVLGAVLPHHVHFQVYQMVLDARASEHSARMVAMKNATDNAKQLIKDLTLEYNKIRQASITTELLEITTAQMALGR